MKWQIDPSHTSIGAKVKHMMVSTLKGRFATLEGAATTSATGTGFPDVGLADVGWNWHVTPAGNPPHEKITVPVNEPADATVKATGVLLVPGDSVSELGDGALRLKSTTCSTIGTLCVTAAGSVPVACKLNE